MGHAQSASLNGKSNYTFSPRMRSFLRLNLNRYQVQAYRPQNYDGIVPPMREHQNRPLRDGKHRPYLCNLQSQIPISQDAAAG